LLLLLLLFSRYQLKKRFSETIKWFIHSLNLICVLFTLYMTFNQEIEVEYVEKRGFSAGSRELYTVIVVSY